MKKSLYEELAKLDIHSINLLPSRLGKPYGRIVVSVEQGFIDKDKCRSNIKHVFYADTMEDILEMTFSRAKALYYVGVSLPIIPETNKEQHNG